MFNDIIYTCGLMFGICGGLLLGFWLGVVYRNRLYTRFWIEVEPEYEFYVVKAIKLMDLCKKSIVYAQPSLYLNKDGTIKYESPTTTIIVELSDGWFARAKDFSSNEQESRGSLTQRALENIRSQIERQDLKVINCGVY
jgi:hypothetical protein